MLPGFNFFFGRRPKRASEAVLLIRLRAPHRLHQHELDEIHEDAGAGYARTLAGMEIERRSRLSEQEAVREAARRWSGC